MKAGILGTIMDNSIRILEDTFLPERTMVVSSDIANYYKKLPKQQTELELKAAPEIQHTTKEQMYVYFSQMD
jgi:hypothetical protein